MIYGVASSDAKECQILSDLLRIYVLLAQQLVLSLANRPQSLIQRHVSADIQQGLHVVFLIQLSLTLVVLFHIILPPFSKQQLVPLFQLIDEFLEKVVLSLKFHLDNDLIPQFLTHFLNIYL